MPGHQSSYAATAMARHRAGVKTMLIGLTERLDALETTINQIAVSVGSDRPPVPTPEHDQQHPTGAQR